MTSDYIFNVIEVFMDTFNYMKKKINYGKSGITRINEE